MKNQLYFIKENIFAMTKQEVVEYMKEFGLTELEVFKAKRIKVNGFFFCKIYGVAEKDDMTCGKKWCENYEPCNGKSGCCRNVGSLYDCGDALFLTC